MAAENGVKRDWITLGFDSRPRTKENQMTHDEILRSWPALNTFLLTATEQDCQKLMARERDVGQNRARVLLRIHSRLNKLRAHRERRELAKGARR